MPSRSIIHGELRCLPVGGSGVDAELKGQELEDGGTFWRGKSKY